MSEDATKSPFPNPDEKRIAELKRMQFIATGLLVLMLILMIISKFAESKLGLDWMSYVHAFAEAATVGALADWFAVTALFRYPLGLKIPHTAIIRKNKDSIGRGLGSFVENNFLTEEAISREVRGFDFATRAETWLAKTENSMEVAERITNVIPELLKSTDDENVREFFANNITNVVERMDVGEIAGRILEVIIENDKDHRLFDELVKAIDKFVEENTDVIQKYINQEVPRTAKFFLGGSKGVNDKVMTRLNKALTELAEDPNHPMRERFLENIQNFVKRLKEDKEFRKQINDMKQEMLHNPAVQTYFGNLWNDLKATLLRDTQENHGELKRRIFRAIFGLSNSLLNDPEVRTMMNEYLYTSATQVVVQNKSAVTKLIEQTVEDWNEETMVRRLEILVGKDLQFIRINGTLVGGIVGTILHAISEYIHII